MNRHNPITSYGGLVEGLSIDEFFSGRSMPRNRELMRVFRDLEFAEHLGSGMNRILRAYDKSIFHLSENFVEIVFPYEEEYLRLTEQVTEQVTPEVAPEVIPEVEKLGNDRIAPHVTPQVAPELERPGNDMFVPHVTEHVTEQVKKLVFAIKGELTSVEIMNYLNLKGRPNFVLEYLQPALKLNLIEMTIPDKPKSRFQKYRLTAKGVEIKKELGGKNDELA